MWMGVTALPALSRDDPGGLQASGAIFGKREMWKTGRAKAIQSGLEVSSQFTYEHATDMSLEPTRLMPEEK